jgi:chaperonin GroES
MSETTYNIKKPQPIFRRNLRTAPAHPIDDRILVRENAPESVTQTGIAVPDSAKERAMNGVLIAVGDTAADYLYDRGIEVGDVVLYAKYAGVVEEWQHIVGPDDTDCEHDGAWDHVPRPSGTLDALRGGKDKDAIAAAKKWEMAGGNNENIELRECRACGTLRATERMIVMSCKDVLMDVDLQERLETGVMARYRGISEDTGQTRFYIRRLQPRPDCYGPIEPTTTTLKGVA